MIPIKEIIRIPVGYYCNILDKCKHREPTLIFNQESKRNEVAFICIKFNVILQSNEHFVSEKCQECLNEPC